MTRDGRTRSHTVASQQVRALRGGPAVTAASAGADVLNGQGAFDLLASSGLEIAHVRRRALGGASAGDDGYQSQPLTISLSHPPS